MLAGSGPDGGRGIEPGERLSLGLHVPSLLLVLETIAQTHGDEKALLHVGGADG